MTIQSWPGGPVHRRPSPGSHRSGSSHPEAQPEGQRDGQQHHRWHVRAERRGPDPAPPNSQHPAAAPRPQADHHRRMPAAHRRQPTPGAGLAAAGTRRASATRHRADGSTQSATPASAVPGPLTPPLLLSARGSIRANPVARVSVTLSRECHFTNYNEVIRSRHDRSQSGGPTTVG